VLTRRLERSLGVGAGDGGFFGHESAPITCSKTWAR
jgi:hypothetical protein